MFWFLILALLVSVPGRSCPIDAKKFRQMCIDQSVAQPERKVRGQSDVRTY